MTLRLLIAVCLVALGSFARADDWTQFRGPDRLGTSKEKGLLKVWPKGGPTLAWTYKTAGLGFSSVAVSKGVVYTLGTDMKQGTKGLEPEDEYLIAIHEKDGIEKWRTRIGPVFTFKDNTWGDGPRGTPTVDGDLIYGLGGHGELVCVDLKGKEVWRKNLIKDFGGVMMTKWGYSESPLVDDNLVICSPGGPNGTLAALDKKTGAVKWRSKAWTDAASYSSPVVGEIHGKRQYIQVGFIDDVKGSVLASVDAKTGNVLWSTPLTTGSAYSISPTPLVKGNQIYVSTEQIAQLFEIDEKNKVAGKYAAREKRVIKDAYGGVALLDGIVYGHTHNGGWASQDFASGMANNWSDRVAIKCNSGIVIAADGMIYAFTDEGDVALIDADPKGFNVVSEFKIAKSKIPAMRPTSQSSLTWAHPAIANGHLFIRDHEFIFGYKITK